MHAAQRLDTRYALLIENQETNAIGLSHGKWAATMSAFFVQDNVALASSLDTFWT